MIRQPSDDEFFWESEVDLRHGPTGALFTVYPNGASKMIDWGTAGQTLPGGDAYLELELLFVASAIIERMHPGSQKTRPS